MDKKKILIKTLQLIAVVIFVFASRLMYPYVLNYVASVINTK